MFRKSSEDIPVGSILKIVRDGLVATKDVHRGVSIPLLRLDTSNRPDIQDLLSIHSAVEDGDVVTQWAEVRSKERQILLVMRFVKPLSTIAAISFNVERQGVLIDSILYSRRLYIEGGTLEEITPILFDERPRVFVALPDNGFDERWSQIRDTELYKKNRNAGLNRKEAKEKVRLQIEARMNLLTSKLFK